MSVKSAGYSGRPLSGKLGIEQGTLLLAVDAPDDYASLLAPLPDGVRFVSRAGASVDIAHVFVISRAEMARRLAALRKSLRPDVPVWVSWPKKTSKVPTDITEDTIREVAFPLGFVDIKVCAVSEVWSGLKLGVRKELR